jgi:DNA invertase Pin-like site-specific DNA recombinase
MRTVKYIRVSTTEQNVDRQRESGVKSYVDVCSGSIAFGERAQGAKLLADISSQYKLPPNKQIRYIKVHSISRFGRSTLDILHTVKEFTDKGVGVIAEKEGIKTLDDEGNENPTARMVLSIMATLAEYERELILERQREGIAAAHKRGVYKNGGRPKESPAEFLMKLESRKILALLSKGISVRETAFRCKVSNGKVQKVKKVGTEMQMLNADFTFDKVDDSTMELAMKDTIPTTRGFKKVYNIESDIPDDDKLIF